jgi:2-polyprenyl-3-methyl-5-hydroxy-6-metoxy-1,4-benzoquinol methylase
LSKALVETRLVDCNLCGSSRSSFLFKATDRLHGTPGEYTYVRCESCGLVYMNPQVTGDLSPLYPAAYEPHAAPGDMRRRTGLVGRVRNLPGLGRFLREAMSATLVDEWVAAELTPSSRWLDVGSGNGAFLLRVRERVGCEIHGLDISSTAVEAARSAGIDVHRGTIEEAPHPDDHFDVVSGWWYLEHVADPVGVVKRIRRLLKPRGLCILAVPNYASLNARAFRARWYHLDCPRHLTLWSGSTMSRLLKESGLELDRVRYDKSAWGLLGSLGHSGIALPRPLSPVLLPWTIATGLLHVSDTIVVYGRKH